MILVLAEAPVVLIPEEYRRRRSVRRFMERFGLKYPVLDVNYTPDVCREMGITGRPDILHFSLLLALESPLARKGMLDVYFTTVEGKTFHVLQGTRLPRNYGRFLGVLGKALAGKGERIKEVDGFPRKGKVILLHEKGEDKRVGFLDSTVIVGMFPHGDYKVSYGEDERIRLGSLSLNGWDVVARVVVLGEIEGGLLNVYKGV